MNKSILEKNELEVFDKTNFYYGRLLDPDIIGDDLDNLDNNFKGLFSIPLFTVYDVD